MSNAPKQLVCNWETGDRFLSQILFRDDWLQEDGDLQAVLADVNSRTSQSHPGDFDHVTIWCTTEARSIDIASDAGVAIVPLSEGISMETPHDNTIMRVGIGTLTMTPSTPLPSGKWLNIVPTANSSYWMEIRRSEKMQGKDCNDGEHCRHAVCGFSNHGRPPP